MLAPPVEYSVKAAVEPEASKKAVIEACEPQIIQNELEITEASSANESSSNPAQNDSEKPAVSQQIPETTKKPQTIAWDNDGDLEALVQETLSKKDPKMHTHPYSGDRLWNDEKCPICRIKAQPVVFESKELKVAKEKYHDKMLLTLSLDLDRELIRKAMVFSVFLHFLLQMLKLD